MQQKRSEFDVFVVGGGPAGIAAAIAAQQQGFRCAVADLLRPPIDKACGEGLMPDSWADLARLGVHLDQYEHGRFRGIRFVGEKSSTQAEFPSGNGIGVRRTVFHSALLDHAEKLGVKFHWGVRVDGITKAGVFVDGRLVTSNWIVGADGQNSLVRKWASLERSREFEKRIALRRHFKLVEMPEYVEIHWGEQSQAYMTPIGQDEVCVAIISKRKFHSFEDELRNIPTMAALLRGAQATSEVRGAATISNRLHRVYRNNVALLGEASGSVDAITGEGLALCFRQAIALSEAMVNNDLAEYQKAHRKIEALPQFMRRSMLLMDKSRAVRHRTLHALHQQPAIFARMLSVHVGELPLRQFGLGMLANLGWEMLKA